MAGYIALWIIGSPCIDKVQVPKELKVEGESGRIDAPIDGETVMPQEEAAALMGAFWEHAYTECNLAKAISGACTGAESERRQGFHRTGPGDRPTEQARAQP